MLTSEEFTELVFGEERSSTLDPAFRQEARGWRVDYTYQFFQNDVTTYSVTLARLVSNFSFILFTVTTDEEGYEEDLVLATQEFVDRLSSLEGFSLHAEVPLSSRVGSLARNDSLALWSGVDLKECCSPLERLLLAGIPNGSFSSTGIKHLLSPQEALSLLPERFTFTQRAKIHDSLFALLSSTQVEEKWYSYPDPSISFVHLVGTPVTKAALEEVVAFARTLDVKDEAAWQELLYILLLSTPWHPEQRPEGMAYADLFPPGQLPESAFLRWLSDSHHVEEEPYLGLRWIQEQWGVLPKTEEEIVALAVEWASPVTVAGKEQFNDALPYLAGIAPGCLLFLQTLLPHREEFTEEARVRLLHILCYYVSEGKEVEPAVEPIYNRLLAHVLQHLGAVPLARLFLSWPEGEEALRHMEDAEVLFSHPEWASLPTTWWLPFLRQEIGEASKASS